MTPVQVAVAQAKEAIRTLWGHRMTIGMALATFLALSVTIVVFTPRNYKAGANVLIVNGNTRNDPTLSSPDLPALATSTSVLTQVDRKLGLGISLSTLKGSVTVKPPPFKSSLMRIEYSDHDPNRAATVANGVADELAAYYNRLSTSRFDDDLRSLDAELAKQKGRIELLDVQISAAGSSRSAVTQVDGPGASDDQLNSLKTEEALADSALQGDSAQAKAVAVDGRTRSLMTDADIVQADPLYRALQVSLSAATADFTEARGHLTDSHPALQSLRAKVDGLSAQLAREKRRALSAVDRYSPEDEAARLAQRKSDAVVTADRAKVTALRGEINRFDHQTQSQAPFALMRLEREAAMTEYRSIASHRASTLLDRADALSLGSVDVVDRALGSQAQVVGIAPRRLIIILSFLSLLVALGCGYLAEQLKPRRRRAAQIDDLYGKPVVAKLDKTR